MSRMIWYAAPMEGVTGCVFRRAQHELYPGIDKFFSPFITPNQKKTFRSREMRDILPENNEGLNLVPQVLTNSAEDFVFTAMKLKDMGYVEVNLNLGCPSGTVTAKGKGAGFLADTDALDRFFDGVFSSSDIKLSVKTRIGIESAEELPGLMEVFNRYPISELIVHPRVMKQQYRGKADRNAFRRAFSRCRCPICYNGDIFSPEDMIALQKEFPGLERVMLGRGLAADPQLQEKCASGTLPDAGRLRAFHDRVFEGYLELNMGERNLLFKMKDLWSFMIYQFRDADRQYKALRKASTVAEYISAVDRIFADCGLGGSYKGRDD